MKTSENRGNEKAKERGRWREKDNESGRNRGQVVTNKNWLRLRLKRLFDLFPILELKHNDSLLRGSPYAHISERRIRRLFTVYGEWCGLIVFVLSSCRESRAVNLETIASQSLALLPPFLWHVYGTHTCSIGLKTNGTEGDCQYCQTKEVLKLLWHFFSLYIGSSFVCMGWGWGKWWVAGW